MDIEWQIICNKAKRSQGYLKRNLGNWGLRPGSIVTAHLDLVLVNLNNGRLSLAGFCPPAQEWSWREPSSGLQMVQDPEHGTLTAEGAWAGEGKAQGWSGGILWPPEGDLQRWQSHILRDRKLRQDKLWQWHPWLHIHADLVLCWPQACLDCGLDWKPHEACLNCTFKNFPNTTS